MLNSLSHKEILLLFPPSVVIKLLFQYSDDQVFPG